MVSSKKSLVRDSDQKTIEKVVCVIDKALSFIIYAILILFLLFSGYAMYDNWQIFDSANISDSLLKYKAVLESSDNYDFTELMSVNPDITAWLTIDDTEVDYPVMQGKDNYEYLNKDIYGNYSLSGSLFLDYRISLDDPYLLIYGHHMNANKMFGTLDNYKNEEYYENHRKAELYVQGEYLDIQIMGCFTTTASDSHIFMPGEDIQKKADYFNSKSIYDDEIHLEDGERLIALSTCSDSSTNARLVVYGVIL